MAKILVFESHKRQMNGPISIICWLYVLHPNPGVRLTTHQLAKYSWASDDPMSTLVNSIHRDSFLYIFSCKHTTSHIIIQEFDMRLFYKPKYIKTDCPNIFYKHSVQGNNPALFILTASKECRPLVYLKEGSHDEVSKAQ